MKRIILFFTAVLLSSFLMAQDFDKVTEAFSKGNATALGQLMDNTLEFAMDGKTSNISKSDAENRLRSFFMDCEPRNFESVHKGVSKSDVHYMIGQLYTSKGVYRVTFYMHKAISDYVIQSLEIENGE
jgi:hypothetical protein